MDYSIMIPCVLLKIEKVLAKLNIAPKFSPQEFIKKTKGQKHRYSSVCRNEKGKKIIFYARLYKSSFDKERMRTEIFLAKELKKKKKSLEYFPQYYNFKIEKDFEWLTRQYFPLSSLENEKEIEKLKRNLKKKEISKIAKTIFEMNNLPISHFLFLKKFKLNNYLKCEKLAYSLLEEKIISKNEFEKAERVFKENHKLLKSENKYFCHGDFHIGNIIIFKKEVKVIDLESAQINNFAFDISFLTTRLWRNPKTRKKIIKAYFNLLPAKKRKIFSILFRIDTFFIAYYTFKSRPTEYNLSQIKKRKVFLRKLLKNSIKNFESLIENK